MTPTIVSWRVSGTLFSLTLFGTNTCYRLAKLVICQMLLMSTQWNTDCTSSFSWQLSWLRLFSWTWSLRSWGTHLTAWWRKDRFIRSVSECLSWVWSTYKFNFLKMAMMKNDTSTLWNRFNTKTQMMRIRRSRKRNGMVEYSRCRKRWKPLEIKSSKKLRWLKRRLKTEWQWLKGKLTTWLIS